MLTAGRKGVQCGRWSIPRAHFEFHHGPPKLRESAKSGVNSATAARQALAVWEMAEVERISEHTADGVRAGAIVSTMSQAVQERESTGKGFKFAGQAASACLALSLVALVAV